MSQISSVTRSKQQARSAYNKLSRWYDLVAGDFERKPRNAAIYQLDPGIGESILEIGCGTGQAIVKMAEFVGRSSKIYGIDISTGMLDIAQSRAKKTGQSNRVTLLCGDGTWLPFYNGSFDGILISFTLELFDTPEIPQVLAECKRCLRTGGRISVVGLSRKHPNFMTGLYEWFHSKFPQFFDCRPIFVQQSLESAGFKIISANDLSMMGLKGELVLVESPSNASVQAS
ncbi:MAG: 2-heptaprenyl-1,4-naphthoquinone methyltransferase [Chloroflexi bacterium HGW-Chloroflexi-3]|nr:MAG: 2-heptaprenyl-1,4-naphthoquinone methyltransferase [Chloroflexi bacterium HGW-Chloroflexi-3]